MSVNSTAEPVPVGVAPRKGPLARLLSVGVRASDTRSVARRTRQVNAAASVAIVSILTFVTIQLGVGSTSTLRAASLAVPFAPIFVAVVWMNHLGLRRLARWLAIGGATGSLLLNAVYVGGGHSGVHVLFPVVALVSATLFARSERALVAAVLLLELALYLYFEGSAPSGSADFEALSPELRRGLRGVAGLVGLSVALGVVAHAEASARANEQALAQATTTDPLTGLPNRVALERRLTDVARQASHFGDLAAVLFLDLDRFKPVNDAHGHLVGDRLLVSVAERLATTVRTVDLAARLGGDEFVVVLVRLGTDAHSAEQRAVMVAERIATTMGAAHEVRDERGRVLELVCPVSIGVAVLRPGEAITALLARADSAMYGAKKGPRRVVLATEEPHGPV